MGLEEFSHIWVLFYFHAIPAGERKPTVRPPRLGGNRRVGVFASRSTHRPNSIGISAVQLQRLEISQGRVILYIYGADLLDGTPVIDIKPYIPHVDSIPEAVGGFADMPPQSLGLTVSYAANAEQFLQAHPQYAGADLRALISQILLADPRPAYHAIPDLNSRKYAIRLFDLDVHWQISAQNIEVIAIKTV